MAITIMSTIQRWEGLNADTKPAAPEFAGSTFYETDTGRTYLWNGADWLEVVMDVNTSDYSTLTVTHTTQTLATACTPVMPASARGALITCEANQWRWRDDGTAPTSAEGHLMSPGDILTFDSWSAPKLNWRAVLSAVQVIEVTGTPLLKISWYD